LFITFEKNPSQHKMKGIKNIIFDLGGVIINLNNKLTENAFVELGAKDFNKFFGHGFAASFFKDYEVGKITSEEFINNIKQLGDFSMHNDDKIINAWNVMLLDFPKERIELLKELGKRYRIFLFSNTNALHYEEVRKIYQQTFNEEMNDLFEKTYYSHTHQMRKPDVSSYQFIINENKLNAASTLFVDDAFINIQGAIDAGLQGLYLPSSISIMDIKW
jgi:HAD superfamily hydrolase (TIGR01509 family)